MSSLDRSYATPLYTRSQVDLGKPGKGYMETLLYAEQYGFLLHTRIVTITSDDISTRAVEESQGDILPFDLADVLNWVDRVGKDKVVAEVKQTMRDCLHLLAVLKDES